MSHLGADDADLQPGQEVGEYVVDQKVGEGGFGTVFRATHPLIGKQVAIKVLARQYSANEEMVSRFVAEARAVNQIRHRHIIDIFSFGRLPDGRHYYVMEYLDGQPLDAYLEIHGALPLAQAIPILRDIARALDAAHGNDIVHRDLKPENVFLSQDQDGTLFPKLLDFGIAKLMTDQGQGHKTRTGAPIGTPAYMSPEQCRGKDVDHRTDVYAFGVLAYEMLTGGLPFDHEEFMEIILAHLQKEPDPPSSRQPGLPPGVDQSLLAMLSKDPAARPTTLVGAIQQLEEAARAAGLDLPAAPSPSGVHPAERRLTPTPGRPSGAVAPAISSAETIDAGRLSEQLSAAGAATTGAGDPASKRTGLVVGAVLVVLAAGLVAFLSSRDERAPAEPEPAAELGGAAGDAPAGRADNAEPTGPLGP